MTEHPFQYSALPNIPRRRFLQTAAAAIAAPYFVPSTVLGKQAPSNRIVVGCIGVGNQGMPIMQRFLETPGVQVAAVCDVNRGSYGYKEEKDFYGREPAQKLVNEFYGRSKRSGDYAGCDAYSDFREVLGHDDIDAVTIVVPDHWHAVMTIRAAEAGKDIFCEKPLSLTVSDGRAMVEAVRKHKRILQTGSHERSNRVLRRVCELVQGGRIGALKQIVTNVGFNNKVGPGPGWQPMPVPEGFDYETWLGPAPSVPYHQDRCLYRFRFNYDYSGGQITNFGAHSNDMAQWAMKTDDTGPTEVELLDAKFLPEGSLFNTAIETRFRCRYSNGVELLCRSGEPSVQARFEGSEGWIETGYGGTRSDPESLWKEQKLPTSWPKSSAAHVANFVECVRSRKDPVASVEVGHRSATVCHLGNIAIRLGKKKVLHWDPSTERFTNDDDANGLLRRPMRDPWGI